MQVFIVGSPFETAKALDLRRLNKQIIECKQIYNAITGESKAWANHPCTLMYKNHPCWLAWYTSCLCYYKDGMECAAKECSDFADNKKPPFHTKEYFDQMKRRLYTKNPNHYKQWSDLGESEVNWYFVDGEWRYYKNGKRI